jgi:hypothetical protein
MLRCAFPFAGALALACSGTVDDGDGPPGGSRADAAPGSDAATIAPDAGIPDDLAMEDVDAPQVDGYSRGGDPLSSSAFNHGGQLHNDQCVHLKAAEVPLRYADFSETGYRLRPAELRRAFPLTDDDDGHLCADGEVQLDVREILPTDSGRLLFHRGGHGYQDAGNVKYGHLWIGDLADHAEVIPPPVPNGVPCLASTSPITAGRYLVRPTAIPPELHYPKSNFDDCVRDNGIPACNISYQGYGDPGYQQGDPEVLGERHHYTYLVWSWVNVPGGGVVRTLLRPGHRFYRCNVYSIKKDAIGDDGQVNGWVQVVYGKTLQAGNWIYGWTVYAHQASGDPAPTYHLEPF